MPVWACMWCSPDPDELRRQVAAGCRFIAYGIDSGFLWQAAARPAGAEGRASGGRP